MNSFGSKRSFHPGVAVASLLCAESLALTACGGSSIANNPASTGYTPHTVTVSHSASTTAPAQPRQTQSSTTQASQTTSDDSTTADANDTATQTDNQTSSDATSVTTTTSTATSTSSSNPGGSSSSSTQPSSTYTPTTDTSPVHHAALGGFSTSPVFSLPHAAGQKVVGLTFDDGPSPYSPKILAILQANHIHATFFEIGQQVDGYGKYSKMLSEAGMSIGDHSNRHADMTKQSLADVRETISLTDGKIKKTIGITPTCVRPPYGATDRAINSTIASSGHHIIMWNVDSEDWSRPGVSKIVSNVMSEVKPGSIILMHDGGGDRSESVAALPIIINKLRAEGYSFVSVC